MTGPDSDNLEPRETGMNQHCLFCNVIDREDEIIIAQNEYAYAVRDKYPVTYLHSLIIPKHHVSDYFGLPQSDLIGCDALIRVVKEDILAIDSSVQGFNIGINCGAEAGQTIFHCHIHLIPRRKGDVDNPRGGVRHVIAGKGFY